MNNLVSIIIRTKNEERWISQTLQGVFSQKYKNVEVIIVDNDSSDKTLEKARQFNVHKVATCKDYLPGKALNIGISESRGDYIACLSGHCIPVNEDWLGNLIKHFEEPDVAGVYGRQEPMSFTSDSDKRDLALLFGLDKKIQVKDSFFHNANSMIRRSVWEQIPFDETITNIEDRIWAKKALEEGNKIIYEPHASVYHYHGIHQDGNMERCANVVRILESLHSSHGYNKSIDIEKLNVVAIVPVRGKVRNLNGKPLVYYTLKRALESKYIKTTIVSTDNAEVARLAESFGATAPFIRDPLYSKEHIDIGCVLQHSLKKIEETGILPDIIVLLEATFPFRTEGLLDDMILQLAENGLDTIIAAKRENRGIWKERAGDIVRIEEGMTPRQFKDPTFIELRGVGCVTHPEFVRSGNLIGEKIGIYEVKHPCSHIEVRGEDDFELASALISKLF